MSSLSAGLRLAYDPILGVWGTDLDLGPAGSGSISFADVTVDVDLLDGRVVGVFVDRVPWSPAAAAVLETIVGTDTPHPGDPARALVLDPPPGRAAVHRLLTQVGRMRGLWHLDHPTGTARHRLWAAEMVEAAGDLAQADPRLALDVHADARAAADLFLAPGLVQRLADLAASRHEAVLPRFQRLVRVVADHPANSEHRHALRTVAVELAEAAGDTVQVAFDLLGQLSAPGWTDRPLESALTRGGTSASRGSGPPHRPPPATDETPVPQGRFGVDLTRIRRGLIDPQASVQITAATDGAFVGATEIHVPLMGRPLEEDLFARAVVCDDDADPQVLGLGRMVSAELGELVARLALPPAASSSPSYYVEVVHFPDAPLLSHEEHQVNVAAPAMARVLFQEGVIAVESGDGARAVEFYRRAEALYRQIGHTFNTAHAARAARTVPRQLEQKGLAATYGDGLQPEQSADDPEDLGEPPTNTG